MQQHTLGEGYACFVYRTFRSRLGAALPFKGSAGAKFFLGVMGQNKEARLFPLLPLFSVAYKHMPLNTMTLKAILARQCGMGETSSGPLLKDYLLDVLCSFRDVPHGRITTNGTDVSVQCTLSESDRRTKMVRAP